MRSTSTQSQPESAPSSVATPTSPRSSVAAAFSTSIPEAPDPAASPSPLPSACSKSKAAKSNPASSTFHFEGNYPSENQADNAFEFFQLDKIDTELRKKRTGPPSAVPFPLQ